MSQRGALELLWFQELSPTNRADWMTRWLTDSPYDITGHVYTPYTPSAFIETHVAAQTAYAWSQMYGRHRFNHLPVFTPVNTHFISPGCGNAQFTRDFFTIDYNATATGLTSIDILVFASGTLPKKPTKSPGALRPMCAMAAQPATGTLDFWNCWHHRFGADNPSNITATVALVNVNNELVRSLDIVTAAVAP